MPSTEELIVSLSDGLAPVRPLRPPLLRALGWIAFATALVLALSSLRGFRADLAHELREPAFLVQLGAAWLTGALATLAAFEISLPDRAWRWLLLPLPSLALWLYGFAYGCLRDWVAIPAGAPIVADSVQCLTTILLASLPLALILWLMLRKARPLRPGGTAWLAALAVAAFADVAHLLVHVIEASLLVLVVNLAPAAMIVAAGGLVGRGLLAKGGAARS
jgi:hypothetical protein